MSRGVGVRDGVRDGVGDGAGLAIVGVTDGVAEGIAGGVAGDPARDARVEQADTASSSATRDAESLRTCRAYGSGSAAYCRWASAATCGPGDGAADSNSSSTARTPRCSTTTCA